MRVPYVMFNKDVGDGETGEVIKADFKGLAEHNVDNAADILRAQQGAKEKKIQKVLAKKGVKRTDTIMDQTKDADEPSLMSLVGPLAAYSRHSAVSPASNY